MELSLQEIILCAGIGISFVTLVDLQEGIKIKFYYLFVAIYLIVDLLGL